MNTAGGSTSDQLAHERTDLAGSRTAMAADRTLMAWIRTALSMISFGFTIYKFLTSAIPAHVRRPDGPRNLGLFLTILGTVSMAAGLFQYAQTMRQLGMSVARKSVTFYVAAAVVILGLVILVGIGWGIGPF